MLRIALAAVAVLALTSPALAAVPPPGQAPREAGRMHRLERMAQRIDRAVQAGKLTPEQGQKLKDEAEGIRVEVQANRAANADGKLTPEQREHVKLEVHALKEKLHAATGAHVAPPATK